MAGASDARRPARPRDGCRQPASPRDGRRRDDCRREHGHDDCRRDGREHGSEPGIQPADRWPTNRHLADDQPVERQHEAHPDHQCPQAHPEVHPEMHQSADRQPDDRQPGSGDAPDRNPPPRQPLGRKFRAAAACALSLKGAVEAPGADALAAAAGGGEPGEDGDAPDVAAAAASAPGYNIRDEAATGASGLNNFDCPAADKTTTTGGNDAVMTDAHVHYSSTSDAPKDDGPTTSGPVNNGHPTVTPYTNVDRATDAPLTPEEDSVQAEMCEELDVSTGGRLRLFLESCGLSHLVRLLHGETVRVWLECLRNDRPEFLRRLKRMGVESLKDRQGISNALTRAMREQSLPVPLPPEPPPPSFSPITSAAEDVLAVLAMQGLSFAVRCELQSTIGVVGPTPGVDATTWLGSLGSARIAMLFEQLELPLSLSGHTLIERSPPPTLPSAASSTNANVATNTTVTRVEHTDILPTSEENMGLHRGPRDRYGDVPGVELAIMGLRERSRAARGRAEAERRQAEAEELRAEARRVAAEAVCTAAKVARRRKAAALRALCAMRRAVAAKALPAKERDEATPAVRVVLTVQGGPTDVAVSIELQLTLHDIAQSAQVKSSPSCTPSTKGLALSLVPSKTTRGADTRGQNATKRHDKTRATKRAAERAALLAEIEADRRHIRGLRGARAPADESHVETEIAWTPISTRHVQLQVLVRSASSKKMAPTRHALALIASMAVAARIRFVFPGAKRIEIDVGHAATTSDLLEWITSEFMRQSFDDECRSETDLLRLYAFLRCNVFPPAEVDLSDVAEAPLLGEGGVLHLSPGRGTTPCLAMLVGKRQWRLEAARPTTSAPRRANLGLLGALQAPVRRAELNIDGRRLYAKLAGRYSAFDTAFTKRGMVVLVGEGEDTTNCDELLFKLQEKLHFLSIAFKLPDRDAQGGRATRESRTRDVATVLEYLSTQHPRLFVRALVGYGEGGNACLAYACSSQKRSTPLPRSIVLLAASHTLPSGELASPPPNLAPSVRRAAADNNASQSLHDTSHLEMLSLHGTEDAAAEGVLLFHHRYAALGHKLHLLRGASQVLGAADADAAGTAINDWLVGGRRFSPADVSGKPNLTGLVRALLPEGATCVDLSVKLDGAGSAALTCARAVWLAEELRTNEHVRSLDLSNNTIGDIGAEALAAVLASNATLTTLSLRANNIRGGAKWIASALPTSSLRSLSLQSNSIGGTGVIALARALQQGPTSLTQLNLRDVRAGVWGAAAVAASLHSNSTLDCLNLAENGIGDVGGIALAEALGVNRTLRTLNLSSNRLTRRTADELCAHLSNNCSLENLDIRANPMGEACATEFAETFRMHHNTVNLQVDMGAMEELTMKDAYDTPSEISAVGSAQWGDAVVGPCAAYDFTCNATGDHEQHSHRHRVHSPMSASS